MYPVKDRLQALSLISEGRSLNAVSKETGISRAALTISVSTRAGVARLDELVGPKE